MIVICQSRTFFETNFSGDVNMFQEYHALIVEHAKRYYSKKTLWCK